MLSAFFAALLGFMLIFLSVNTIKARRNFGIGIGFADDIAMQRIMRAQANFTEYTPIFLILLVLAELKKLNAYAVIFLGCLFVLGRIMHAFSLLKHEKYQGARLTSYPTWRVRGMVCTFLCIAILSIVLILQTLLCL